MNKLKFNILTSTLYIFFTFVANRSCLIMFGFLNLDGTSLEVDNVRLGELPLLAKRQNIVNIEKANVNKMSDIWRSWKIEDIHFINHSFCAK